MQMFLKFLIPLYYPLCSLQLCTAPALQSDVLLVQCHQGLKSGLIHCAEGHLVPFKLCCLYQVILVSTLLSDTCRPLGALLYLYKLEFNI